MLISNKKHKMLLLSLVIVLVMAAGATIAYIHTNTQSVANTFEKTYVTCDVTETFSNNVKSKVAVTNTGNIPAYIRAEVVVSWKNEAGDVYGKTPVTGSENAIDNDYTISYNLSANGWVEGSDGFYYYNSAVAAGASTDVLINSCAPVAGKEPADDYFLSVEIIASAIQADGKSLTETTANAGDGEIGMTPVELAWGVEF